MPFLNDNNRYVGNNNGIFSAAAMVWQMCLVLQIFHPMRLTFDVHVIAANSFIFFVIVQRIVNTRHIVGHQILKDNAIYINIIGARFRA